MSLGVQQRFNDWPRLGDRAGRQWLDHRLRNRPKPRNQDSLLLTAGAMAAVTAFRGREPSGDVLPLQRTGWLHDSQFGTGRLEIAESRGPALPALLGLAVVLVGILLCFVVFW